MADQQAGTARIRRISVRLMAVVATIAAAAGLAPAATVAAAQPAVSMKLLVIAADGTETDFPAITSFLDQVGVPYDTILADRTPLTAATLAASPTQGRYQGIVLTTGNLTFLNPATGSWESALTPDEWTILHTYQSQYGARSVTSFTFPEAAYGLGYVGYKDTLNAPINSTLTTAGRLVFPNVNAANPVPLSGAWVYLGNVIDPTVTTPLLTTTVDGQTYPVASITRFADGRENLAITAANNPNLVHSLVLSTGWINWVTRGLFLGGRRASLDIQIDDLFMSNDLWDPATNTTLPERYRTTPGDITALVNWQNANRARPSTPDLKVEFAFVGEGSVAGTVPNDTLVAAVQANKSQFGFINHTLTHFNMDCGECDPPTGIISTTPKQIQDEIKQNAEQGKRIGLPFDVDTMVQPDISGINTPANPMAQKAAADAGIRFWIGDTSHAGQNNPTFNTGFYTAGDGRLYVVPRRPSNLFYPVSTPAEWTSIYNAFYAPGGILCAITTCFSAPQSYAQIVDHESDYFLRFLLQGDNDPLMFHTGNVRAYDGVHSLLSDVMDATLAKYRALLNPPVRTLSFKTIGNAQQDRSDYEDADIVATLTPCANVTLSVPALPKKKAKAAKNTPKVSDNVTVPLSGVSFVNKDSKVDVYGGVATSNITIKRGRSVVVPLPAC